MKIPIEDTAIDVIGKAQRGLGLSDTQLAEKARVKTSDLKSLRRGDLDEMVLWRIAPVLDLAGRALVELSAGNYSPPSIEIPDGLAIFNTPYDDMMVNAYLIWDPKKREAIAFDTGADCSPMLNAIEQHKLAVRLVLLTHSHADHIADLRRLQLKTGAPVCISSKESAAGTEAIEEGREFRIGRLAVRSLLTWGHSRGGMTYFVEGLKRPVAIVGDAIFAGSMGGGAVSYADALQTNMEKILTLPDETILCPGHGPMTTVAHEKEHNPFFAARAAKDV